MGDGFWTTERVALLKRLWMQGQTATAIAAELGGLSRTAVLGKIFRLRPAPAKRATRQNRESAPKEKRKRGKAARVVRPDAPARRRAAKAKPTANAQRSKTLTRKDFARIDERVLSLALRAQSS